MKTLLVFATLIILIGAGCRKESTAMEYKGEVLREHPECNSSIGYPYSIKYINEQNKTDTLLTASLPIAFKIIGTKILFKINETVISPDKEIFCVGIVMPPPNKSIYDVKSQ